jgi:hypothetical protein
VSSPFHGTENRPDVLHRASLIAGIGDAPRRRMLYKASALEGLTIAPRKLAGC